MRSLRMPQTPPALSIPTGRDEAARFFRLAANSGPLVRNKYLHWDELRRREPPEGFTLEQWWSVLVFVRSASAVFVEDMFDKKANPFRYSLVEPVQRALHEIDSQCRGNIRAPEPILNESTRDRYLVNSLIEEAITSSQLEGATTTNRVARDMLRTRRQPRDHSERMILNNFRTMQRIRELRDEQLTPDLVKEVHAIVTDDTLKDDSAAGRFRRPDEEVEVVDQYNNVYHVPPPAEELARRVQKMCDFANGKTKGFVHPVLRAMITHFWLAYDHPFVDGNGRTARALFYWCMLNNDYWMFEFVSISRKILVSPKKYARAYLYTETDENDLTYFLLYHLRVIELAMKDLNEYIVRKSNEMRASVSQLVGMRQLNARQKALVTHALKHPGHEYTIASHQTSHNVAYQTARTDLLSLSAEGLLSQELVGKKFVFIADVNLVNLLKDGGG